MMKKTSYQTIAKDLAARIETGEYRPMDRLPPERRLAESFSVSRNTVREAIRTLVEKGLVESRPGAGNFVAEQANDQLASAMLQDLKKKRFRLQEVFEIRKMLEPQIAALAASRISDTAMLTLEDIVRQQTKSVETGRDTTELDELFHRCLVRATGNSVLLTVYERINGILSESRTRELQTRERIRLSIETHAKITAALQSRDVAGAADLMRQHMTEIETNLLSQVDPETKHPAKTSGTGPLPGNPGRAHSNEKENPSCRS